jgi:hypothetical protein
MSGKCETCKFWSDKIAKAEDGITVCMCLHAESPKRGKYTAQWGACDQHEAGESVDADCW